MTRRERSPNTSSRKKRGRQIAATNSEVLAADTPRTIMTWITTGIMWLCLGAVIFVLTYRPVADPDTWFHLKLGEYIAKTDSLPHTDPFSYTAGDTPYVPSGWLTSVIMERLDRIYPESSRWLILMVTAIVALVAVVVMFRALRSRTTIVTGLLLMAGLCMAVVRFSPRPDVWSILGLALLLAVLTSGWRKRSDLASDNSLLPPPWQLWMLTPIIALWANLHAGVLVALPFLATFAAWLIYQWYRTRERRLMHALAAVVVACFAWLATPYGFGLAGLALRISRIPDVSWVLEWMPFFKPGFPLAMPVYITGAILTVAILCLIATRFRAVHPLEIIWIAMLLIMVLLQRRQVGLMAAAVPLLLARHMAPAEHWFRRWGGWRGAVATLVMAGAVAWTQVSGLNGNAGGKPGFGRNCSVLPCITADYLSTHRPPEPIFNSYNLGGYLLYRLSPETKVYIDGRLDTYPHQVWLDMLAVEESRMSIDELVARYGIQTFVIGIADSFGDPMHLATRLAQRPDYMLVHLDDLAAVFVHRSEANVDYLAINGFKSLAPWNLEAMATKFASADAQTRMINEVGRLFAQSPQSATAHALAAYVAWLGQDQAVMSEQLSLAGRIQPGNRLLQIVRTMINRYPVRR